jgi:BirA family transcriptional regulator, biotin operon repressor / biotin---[acetyl-CoA-carboxylase] ligase
MTSIDAHEWSRIANLINMLADGVHHSGEELGEHLGISRAAVWKYIKRLEELGLQLESVKGKGYRLIGSIELLDEKIINQYLDAETKAILQNISIFPEIESTNGYLLKQANIDFHLCLAERQTAGRGRRGRPWISPFARNIYFSLGWQSNSGISALKGLSLLVGCAVIRALRKVGLQSPGLKWPNDILANEKKLAGVLVEIRGDLAGECELVIGVGLNYQMQGAVTDEISQPWTDLHSLAQAEGVSLPSRNQWVAILINELVSMLKQYEHLGFAAYKKEWESCHLYKDKQVELLMGNTSLVGTCLGVDEEGALILRDADQAIHHLHGGEISLRVQS